MRWWWLRPWKQVRILQGNLDACRWRLEHPILQPSEEYKARWDEAEGYLDKGN